MRKGRALKCPSIYHGLVTENQYTGLVQGIRCILVEDLPLALLALPGRGLLRLIDDDLLHPDAQLRKIARQCLITQLRFLLLADQVECPLLEAEHGVMVQLLWHREAVDGDVRCLYKPDLLCIISSLLELTSSRFWSATVSYSL